MAVVAGVTIATSGGDDNDAAAGRLPGVPGGAAEPEEPGKAFTKVPKGCELIKASTIERIAPGTECTPGLMDDADLATMITRSPRWESQGYDSPFLSLDAHVVVMPAAKETYATEKKVALKGRGELYKVIDSRPVSGLGEEAFMVYGGDTDGGLASAQAIVREGNATVTADYTFSRKDSTTTQRQAEEAAIAAARDVLGSLS
ncbi:hypothetical protein [Streptomyces sp. NPDC005017]|uniref:hypothetical protein n=1 Tax=Streptomyces sp. NPDC005017 TaxID=3364706 RepID=UPI00368ECD51